MRFDLQNCLRRHGIELGALSPLQQILLTTDGTVTEILEAYAGEAMRVVKLEQATLDDAQPVPWLDAAHGGEILKRHILLQGAASRRNFLYAESRIAVAHLDERVRRGLLDSAKPIGLLLLEFRVETFKEILDCGRRPAGTLARHFAVVPDSRLVFRTYRMISGGRPVMLITEMFPDRYFHAWSAAEEGALSGG